MPLFSFYGPMPFYLAEIFHGIGFSALVSIKGMLIVMHIACWNVSFSSSYFESWWLLRDSIFSRAV